MLNKVFFSLKKYSCRFIKLHLNHWCYMDYLLPFWALNESVVLLSMQGQKALRFHQKYLNLCSEDERRSFGFRTTWRWVIHDRAFIFGWTIPLIKKKYSLDHDWISFFITLMRITLFYLWKEIYAVLLDFWFQFLYMNFAHLHLFKLLLIDLFVPILLLTFTCL